LLKTNISKVYFAIILLALVSSSIFEMHYVLYLITVLLCYSKISKKTFHIFLFFLSILLIAIFSSFFSDFLLYDWVKDFTYFSKPILALLAGYFVSKNINDFYSVLKIIVFVALFLAITHILEILIYIDFRKASVSDIRNIGGISNEIEVFAIVILILSNKYKNIKIFNNKLLKKIALIILSLSFIFYLSRTMIVTLTIFTLGSYGYLKFTRKALKYGFIVLISFGLFYTYLFSRNFERGKPGIDSFLYKMKIAPAEIFISNNNLNTKNHAYLWDHWRAYEAKIAITQINSNSNWFIGKGLGSLVDLKFVAPLGDGMRYIPTLHNGYVTILYKSGLVGLLFYLCILLSLYLFCYIKHVSIKSTIANNLISGLAIHFLFTTLIVTGMFNIMEPYTFILGMLLFYSKMDKEKRIEE
jgi:hypothetical protein